MAIYHSLKREKTFWLWIDKIKYFRGKEKLLLRKERSSSQNRKDVLPINSSEDDTEKKCEMHDTVYFIDCKYTSYY